jgi:hypothetical protein
MASSNNRSFLNKEPGEFQIIKGFLNEELSYHISVKNPITVGTHIEYRVEGIDPASLKGAFAIQRRFSDFHALRFCL